jgi:hypothetical protein
MVPILTVLTPNANMPANKIIHMIRTFPYELQCNNGLCKIGFMFIKFSFEIAFRP